MQQSASSHQRSPSNRSTPAHDDRFSSRFTPGSQGFAEQNFFGGAGQNFDGQNPLNFQRHLNFDNPQFPPRQSQSFMNQQQQQQPMGMNMNMFGGGMRNQSMTSPMNYQNLPSSNSSMMQQNFGYQNMPNTQGGMGNNMMESMMNNMQLFQQFQQFMQMMNQNPSNLQSFQNLMGTSNNTNSNFGQSISSIMRNPNQANISATQSEARGDESLLDSLGGHLPSESHFVDQVGNFTSRTEQKENAPVENQQHFWAPPKGGLQEMSKNQSQERDPLQETTSNWENAPVGGGNNAFGSNKSRTNSVVTGRENSLSLGKKAEQENTNPYDEIKVGGGAGRDFGNFDMKERKPSYKESVISQNQNKRAQEEQEEEQQQQQPERTNPFDEIKVGGRGARRFEELLEEQLKANPDAISHRKETKAPVGKKTFLKKSSKIHLLKGAKKADKKAAEEDGDGDDNNMYDQDQDQGEDLWSSHGARKINDEGDQGSYNDYKKTLFGQQKSQRNDEELDLFLRNEQKSNMKRRGFSSEMSPEAKRNHHEEENLSDQERGSFKFDDIDEWRSPDRGEYNMNKYMRKSSPATKSELENRKTAQSGEKSQQSQGSPDGYKFDDEEMLNKPWDEERGSIDQINHTEGDDMARKKESYFWEKIDQQPQVAQTRERKKIFEVKEEKKEEVIDAFMDQRVQALDKEISKFKAENERVKSQRKQCEDMLKETERKMEEFRAKMEQEKKEIEDWKQEERKIINHEKKLVKESHHKIYQNVSNKREREEIESLKGHLEELRSDLQTKENKWRTNRENFKKRLEEENLKTLELKQQMKEYEQQRLRKTVAPTGGATAGRNAQQQQKQNSHSRVVEQKKAPQGRFSHARVVEDEESEQEDDDNNGHVIKEEMHEEDSDEENGDYERMFNVPSRKSSAMKAQNTTKFANRNEGHTPEVKGVGQRLHEEVDHINGPRSGHLGFTVDIADRKEFREDDYSFGSNPYYKKYLGGNQRANRIVKEMEFDDGKVSARVEMGCLNDFIRLNYKEFMKMEEEKISLQTVSSDR